jgi:hypothetical protein
MPFDHIQVILLDHQRTDGPAPKTIWTKVKSMLEQLFENSIFKGLMFSLVF